MDVAVVVAAAVTVAIQQPLSPENFTVKDTMHIFHAVSVFETYFPGHPPPSHPETMDEGTCRRDEGSVPTTLTASFCEFRNAMAVTHVVRFKYIFPSPHLARQ